VASIAALIPLTRYRVRTPPGQRQRPTLRAVADHAAGDGSALSMKQGGRLREHPNTPVINQPTDNYEVSGRGVRSSRSGTALRTSQVAGRAKCNQRKSNQIGSSWFPVKRATDLARLQRDPATSSHAGACDKPGVSQLGANGRPRADSRTGRRTSMEGSTMKWRTGWRSGGPVREEAR
jgi:hypothetical protein